MPEALLALVVDISRRAGTALGVTDIVSLCVLGLVVLLALYFVWGGNVNSLPAGHIFFMRWPKAEGRSLWGAEAYWGASEPRSQGALPTLAGATGAGLRPGAAEWPC